jgi:hypothetical protein
LLIAIARGRRLGCFISISTFYFAVDSEIVLKSKSKPCTPTRLVADEAGLGVVITTEGSG